MVMTTITKARKESRFTKFMKVPIRILTKARDFYIQNMTECSGRFDYGTVMGCPTAQIPSALPRSFSTSSTKSTTSNNDDYRELMRAASTRSLAGNKFESDHARKSQQVVPNTVPRSRSVGIERIDEDKACEFDEEDVKAKKDVFPRSRSYAVSRRPTFMS